jgi:hypothetical protein
MNPNIIYGDFQLLNTSQLKVAASVVIEDLLLQWNANLTFWGRISSK